MKMTMTTVCGQGTSYQYMTDLYNSYASLLFEFSFEDECDGLWSLDGVGGERGHYCVPGRESAVEERLLQFDRAGEHADVRGHTWMTSEVIIWGWL